jgi:hypothetical protein
VGAWGEKAKREVMDIVVERVSEEEGTAVKLN